MRAFVSAHPGAAAVSATGTACSVSSLGAGLAVVGVSTGSLGSGLGHVLTLLGLAEILGARAVIDLAVHPHLTRCRCGSRRHGCRLDCRSRLGSRCHLDGSRRCSRHARSGHSRRSLGKGTASQQASHQKHTQGFLHDRYPFSIKTGDRTRSPLLKTRLVNQS